MGLFDFFRTRAPAPAPTPGAELFDEAFLRRLDSLALLSRRALGGARRGERRGKRRGQGIAFADHRPYVAGDDIRFLDVSSYQRLGKLLIRLFEEEEDRSLYLLLDCSASMAFGGGKKLRFAQRLTAALGYVGLSGLDRVSVIALSEGGNLELRPTRGKPRIFRVLRFLSGLEGRGQTHLAAGLKPFVAREKRRGVAILITDLFDPHGFTSGIDVLRFNRFEPAVIQIRDPEEERPQLWGDVRAVDVESGAALEVTVTRDVLEALGTQHEALRDQAARYCAARGVPFFAVSTAQSVDEVVLRVLRQGGLVG